MQAGEAKTHPTYPVMFSPIRLGPVEIPNRFYFSPHGTALSFSTWPSDDYAAYMVERVKDGGCGLVVASLAIHDRGITYQSCAYREESVPAFRAMAEAVHAAGGKIFAQLWYFWGTHGKWEPLSPAAPSLAASAVQTEYMERHVATHEMSKAEIREIIHAFRLSTRHLCQAGFDGVMLHASHAAILEHFTSPFFNRRTDEYGGSFENRMRFLLEVIDAAREEAGGRMAVGIRLNCDERLPGGYDITGAREILQRVAGPGLIDFVDLDIAVEPNQLDMGMPSVFLEPQVYRPWVEAVRGAAGKVPVLSVLGRMTSVADAEAAIAASVCDMVGATRGLIAEPQLVSNARHGFEARSRICIACNWCCAATSEGSQGCAINPASYRERRWGVDTFEPAPRRSRVVVVGAGPGGLEAARVSALKGHQVTLYEARTHLGGALALWAKLPARDPFFKAIEWWERELVLLGVDVRRGARADAAAVLAERPDAVIVATGACYSPGGRSAFLDIDIPGHEQDFVHRPDELLLAGALPSGRVLLLDGEGLHASVGLAEMLAAAGAEVEYVTPGFSPISPRLIDSLEAPLILKRLWQGGITFSPASYIRRIGRHEVTLYNVFNETERTVSGLDAVVLSTGRHPVDSLAKDLEGKVAQLYTIGDALAPRQLASAAYEGQKFARCIGEPGAPNSVREAYFAPNGPELMPVSADMRREFGRAT